MKDTLHHFAWKSSSCCYELMPSFCWLSPCPFLRKSWLCPWLLPIMAENKDYKKHLLYLLTTIVVYFSLIYAKINNTKGWHWERKLYEHNPFNIYLFQVNCSTPDWLRKSNLTLLSWLWTFRCSLGICNAFMKNKSIWLVFKLTCWKVN